MRSRKIGPGIFLFTPGGGGDGGGCGGSSSSSSNSSNAAGFCRIGRGLVDAATSGPNHSRDWCDSVRQ